MSGRADGAVDVEKAQASHIHAGQVMVSVGEQFGGAFAGRISRQGPVGGIGLDEGQDFSTAIYRRGGGEQKLLDAGLLGGFEQVERTGQVDIQVEARLIDAGADAGQRRQMRHARDAIFSEEALDQGHIADIALHQRAGRVFTQTSGVASLDGGVVIVVEVVDDDDAAAAGEQCRRQVATDEAGAAGNKSGHGIFLCYAESLCRSGASKRMTDAPIQFFANHVEDTESKAEKDG